MVNFGILVAEIVSLVCGTPANFNGFSVLAALLHGTLVLGVSQTLRRWREGAAYIRQGGHHVGHRPTFLFYFEYKLTWQNGNLFTGITRMPASADRWARRQFQAVFPVITRSFPTNVIAHLHSLSMDLTIGRTVGPTVDSTVGWIVWLTVKLCKHWCDSRSNYWSSCGNHWPTSEPNAG